MPKSTLFSLTSIPRKPKELCEMPEFEMKCPFVRAALTILALRQYSFSPDDSIEMLELLAGPGSFSVSDLSLLRKKLDGREYIPFSFFANATPENAYDPSLPLTISVKDTAFSYKKDGYATLYVQSSGAVDSTAEKRINRRMVSVGSQTA